MQRKFVILSITAAALQGLSGCAIHTVVSRQMTPGTVIANGQTLIWEAGGSGPSDFYVHFEDGVSPCKDKTQTVLHGKPGSPATCVAQKFTKKQGFIHFGYWIDSDPSSHKDDHMLVVSCGGCGVDGGSVDASQVARAANARKDDPGDPLPVQVKLFCSENVPVAKPSVVPVVFDGKGSVYWSQSDNNAVGWNITFPKALCKDADFDPKTKTLNAYYSQCDFAPTTQPGLYDYVVTMPQCNKNAPTTFQINVTPPAPAH